MSQSPATTAFLLSRLHAYLRRLAFAVFDSATDWRDAGWFAMKDASRKPSRVRSEHTSPKNEAYSHCVSSWLKAKRLEVIWQGHAAREPLALIGVYARVDLGKRIWYILVFLIMS